MRHVLLHRLALACVILLPLAAGAQDLSGSTASELSETMQQLKAAERDQRRIEQERAKVESEMKPLQNELVSLAGKLEANEKMLSKLEGDLKILEDTRGQQRGRLEQRRRQLSAAMKAMARLSHTPVEAVFAMPGQSDETLRAAATLERTTQRLKRQGEELRTALAELEALDAQIREKHVRISEELAALDKSRTGLSKKLDERVKLQEKLESDREEIGRRLASLAQKSSSLKDLIDAIQDSEKLEREARRQRKESVNRLETRNLPHDEPEDGSLRPVTGARGKLKLPAAGRLVSGFGDGNSAETKKGIVVETRPAAQVRAPYDGEVMFTGPFRNYGQMVILRHAGGYHTLLSGLERIDCVPGQILLEGEPVGAMGTDASASRLYMELREGSKPIDPAPWIAGLPESTSG